ncbi:MAG: sensor histidine kinase [Dehalococcoidales bacterium]|nr:sensor histidine kinase [Dehalococcoidales bacterium]
MKQTRGLLDAVYLVRFASLLWIVYLLALFIINQSLGPPMRTAPLYYILYACIALVCLGLACWTWIQERLKKIFIPLIIFITTVTPLIVNWLVVSLFPLVPPSAPDDSYLRPFPFLFMGLLLVAWRYRWQYIILVILVISGLNLGVTWSFAAPRGFPFQGGLISVLMQTVIFLAVGFSISYLMNRLRRQQHSLEEANLRLTHYASTLEHLTVSQERNRLARELHDTLAHTLSGLSVQLEAAKAYWDLDQNAAREVLEKSSAAAHAGLEETRRALKALRASPLEDMGLALAVSTMATDSAARANLSINLQIMDRLPALSPDIEQAVYRIAQEAVSNIINHSQARNFSLKLENTNDKICLVIQDDGIGFEIEKNNQAGHYGITGMKERAHLIGGELTITSKPGAGTRIELII